MHHQTVQFAKYIYNNMPKLACLQLVGCDLKTFLLQMIPANASCEQAGEKILACFLSMLILASSSKVLRGRRGWSSDRLHLAVLLALELEKRKKGKTRTISEFRKHTEKMKTCVDCCRKSFLIVLKC